MIILFSLSPEGELSFHTYTSRNIFSIQRCNHYLYSSKIKACRFFDNFRPSCHFCKKKNKKLDYFPPLPQ